MEKTQLQTLRDSYCEKLRELNEEIEHLNLKKEGVLFALKELDKVRNLKGEN